MESPKISLAEPKRPRKSAPAPLITTDQSPAFEPPKRRPKPRQSVDALKSPKKAEKSNFISAGFQKLRKTMRRKSVSKPVKPVKPLQPAQTPVTINKHCSDSGVDLSKSVNQSITSNSSQVMSPQSESSGISPPQVTQERAYEMGYLNHRERQSKRLQKYSEGPMSDVESVASSRMSSRIKQKPKPRNGRRRRSRSKGDRQTSSTSKSTTDKSRPTSEEVRNHVSHSYRHETVTPSVFGAVSEAGQSTVLLDSEGKKQRHFA